MPPPADGSTASLDPSPSEPVRRSPDFAALLRGQREAARRQQSLRGEYLRTLAEQAEQRLASSRALLIGAIALILGLIVTVATYSFASTAGGVYVIAWGPVVFGLIQIGRGLAFRR